MIAGSKASTLCPVRQAPSAQHTIAKPICFEGVGVHSGFPVQMKLQPAPADKGIVFVRSDGDNRHAEVRARHDFVSATDMCTIIGDPNGIFVSTIEHLMAALSALDIDNICIDINAAEVPVLDGSSDIFYSKIVEAGILVQAARRRYIRIDQPVRVSSGSSWAELVPDNDCVFDVEIDFPDPVIGRQRYVRSLRDHHFCRDVLKARTFGFLRDVKTLRKSGYALGSSFENTVVIGDSGIINSAGLRYSDEFVRHKMLDAVGDLALLGEPFLGRYRSYRGGHGLNYMMVKQVIDQKDCWSYVELTRSVSKPRRHPVGKQLKSAIAAPST